jgi:hypothetical protein
MSQRAIAGLPFPYSAKKSNSSPPRALLDCFVIVLLHFNHPILPMLDQPMSKQIKSSSTFFSLVFFLPSSFILIIGYDLSSLGPPPKPISLSLPPSPFTQTVSAQDISNLHSVKPLGHVAVFNLPDMFAPFPQTHHHHSSWSF